MPPGGLQWFAPQDIVARVGSPVLRDAVTLSALAVAARSDLVPEWSAAPLVENSPANRGTTDETSRLTLSELRVPTRSEERRVGKECRSSEWQNQKKGKEE